MGKSKISLYKIPSLLKQTERIEASLKLLDLEGIKGCYKEFAEKYNDKNYTFFDFLEAILTTELAGKEGKRIQRWLQIAKFPSIKTLEEFEFSFNKTINQKKILELASSRFVENKENVIFLGPPGVGKTHLSIALGIEAIYKGYEVRFIELKQLIDFFDKADGNADYIRRLTASLLTPKLLIIDEVDSFEVNSAVSTLLSKIFIERYEKGSIIVTSNRTFKDWQSIFGQVTRAAMIIDRLKHRAKVFNIEGDSYRIKGGQERLTMNEIASSAVGL